MSDTGRNSSENISHVIGVFSLFWAVVAWAEWFLIPILFPADGGPVPHLAFAPQAILLFLGCVGVVLTMPVLALATCRWRILLYALPAAAYLLFQFWRVI